MAYIEYINRVNKDVDSIDRMSHRDISKINRMNIKYLRNIVVTGPTEVDERSGAQYFCNAYYTDGTNEVVQADSWEENSQYATINLNGYLTTGEVPNADQPLQITATYNGLSNMLPVTIINRVQLLSIQIEGPITVSERSGAQYNCRAYYDNGVNVLVSPVWSENSPYASINSAGWLATGETPNVDSPCRITANFGGRQDTLDITINNIVLLIDIEITGWDVVDENTQTQYTCTANWDSGVSTDVSSLVSWSTHDVATHGPTPFASVDSSGILTTYETPSEDKDCYLRAEYLGKFFNFYITIKDVAVLDYIVITGPIVVNESSGAQYICTAYYDDGFNEQCMALWSDDSIYASISATGYLTTGDVQHQNRPCTITASYGGKVVNFPMTIVNVIILGHITVSGSQDINEETNEQYVATAYYDNGSSANVTNSAIWSEDRPWATINSTGLLTVGTVASDTNVTVNANYSGMSDTLLVQVRNVVKYLYLEITGPGDVDERSGAQYTATAYYDNGTNTDVTNLAIWSDDSPYGSIDVNGYLTTGETPNQDELCNITASWNGKSDVKAIRINNIVRLLSVVVSGPSTVEERSGAQYTCTAYYDDGSNANASSFATWSALNPADYLPSAYATMNSTGYMTTLETPGVNKAVIVQAVYNGKSDTLGMTVTNVLVLDYILISGPSTVPERSGAQYTCTAYYDDLSFQDVTSSCNWNVDSAISFDLTGNTTNQPS